MWLGAGGVALFIATIFVARAPTSAPPQETGPRVGFDFIAFYTAGTFVREGHSRQLYDLRATREFQHALARRYGADIGQAYGPWWNPPFYALLFVPLAAMHYPMALNLWVAINLLCAGISCWLLWQVLPRDAPWRQRLLVPALLALSTPFIFAISHAQSSCTSLLIAAGVVHLWRSRRALLAGLACGLMFYKPQLAMVLAVLLVCDLGWPAAAGLSIAGIVLLLVTVVALPGSLQDFLHHAPANLQFVQTQGVYPWERHVTLKAFWRLLLQGRHPGQTMWLVTTLSTTSAFAVGGMLVWAILRAREMAIGTIESSARDRLIAAAITAAPLIMPFYFDYDLLLLALPVVLLAGELIEQGQARLALPDRWLIGGWAALYVCLMLNADIAERMRLNVAVPILTIVSSLLMLRLARSQLSSGFMHAEAGPVLLKAA